MENNDKIEIGRDELQAIVNQNRELIALVKQQQTKMSQTVEDGKVKSHRISSNRTVTVLFVDGKPVIGLKNMGSEHMPVTVYEMPDPKDNKKYILAATLIVQDLKTGANEEIRNVNFIEFIQQAERREVSIKRIKQEKWLIDHGTTEKKELAGDSYRMQELGEVSLEVTGIDNWYVLDIDGYEVTMFQDFVNMAKSTPRAEKTIISEITL